jgi:hypothetical protein
MYGTLEPRRADPLTQYSDDKNQPLLLIGQIALIQSVARVQVQRKKERLVAEATPPSPPSQAGLLEQGRKSGESGNWI